MYGESTRTFLGSIPRILPMLSCAHWIIWFAVHSVSLSPSHAAMVANGSIIEWLSSAVW